MSREGTCPKCGRENITFFEDKYHGLVASYHAAKGTKGRPGEPKACVASGNPVKPVEVQDDAE